MCACGQIWQHDCLPCPQIGTGFKDDNLEEHTVFFKEHLLQGPKPYYRYSDGSQPDQWFDSVQVWEVKAADLSISPVYTAAAGIVSPQAHTMPQPSAMKSLPPWCDRSILKRVFLFASLVS